jgi:hypothetical protein
VVSQLRGAETMSRDGRANPDRAIREKKDMGAFRLDRLAKKRREPDRYIHEMDAVRFELAANAAGPSNSRRRLGC